MTKATKEKSDQEWGTSEGCGMMIVIPILIFVVVFFLFLIKGFWCFLGSLL